MKRKKSKSFLEQHRRGGEGLKHIKQKYQREYQPDKQSTIREVVSDSEDVSVSEEKMSRMKQLLNVDDVEEEFDLKTGAVRRKSQDFIRELIEKKEELHHAHKRAKHEHNARVQRSGSV